MPRSVASASSSGTTPTLRGFSRDNTSLIKGLASALGKSDAVEKCHDLQYINERLEGPDADLVPYVISLLRTSSLRSAVGMVTSTAEQDHGKKMPPSMCYYRNLREAQLYCILNKREPTVFSQKALETLGRDELMTLVVFGLGVTVSHKLPTLHALLKHVNVFAEYCNVRYGALGLRLKGWKKGDAGSWGHYRLEGHTVVLTTGDSKNEKSKMKLKQLEIADDWVVLDNHLTNAYLWSANEDLKIPLQWKFSKNGATLPPAESMDWGIEQQDWPTAMQPTRSIEIEDMVAPPKKRSRPKGFGGAAI